MRFSVGKTSEQTETNNLHKRNKSELELKVSHYHSQYRYCEVLHKNSNIFNFLDRNSPFMIRSRECFGAVINPSLVYLLH